MNGALDFIRQRCHVDEDTGCWHWKMHKTAAGIPQCRWAGKVVYAHRVAYEASIGRAAPKSKVVYHKCANVDCCNPAHLACGDRNAQMAAAKKRGTIKRGALHAMTGKLPPQTKLTMEIAREIRARVANGESPYHFYREYGVCMATVYKVAARQSWREGAKNNSVFNLAA